MTDMERKLDEFLTGIGAAQDKLSEIVSEIGVARDKIDACTWIVDEAKFNKRPPMEVYQAHLDAVEKVLGYEFRKELNHWAHEALYSKEAK